jgi:enoyl-CoA hydratase
VRNYKFLSIDVDQDGVALVTFVHPGDDPEGMTSLTDLADVFSDLGNDDDVRVAVLTGADQHFFQGPALEVILRTRADAAAQVQSLRTARITVERIVCFEKPLISAVNGPAFGVGTQVAFLSDFVIAATGSYFQDPHVRLGVAAGDGGVAAWPLIMSLMQVKKYLLTGRRLCAEDAFAFGAVTEVVASASVLSTATDYARELSRLPADAVQLTKRALNQWLRSALLNSFDYANAVQLATSLMPESVERLQRLVERRQLNSEGVAGE